MKRYYYLVMLQIFIGSLPAWLIPLWFEYLGMIDQDQMLILTVLPLISLSLLPVTIFYIIKYEKGMRK